MSKVIQKFKNFVLHRGLERHVKDPFNKFYIPVPRCSGTFIRRHRNIRIIGIIASFALILISTLAIFPITKQPDNAEATYLPATTTLSIVSAKDTASVSITPTSSTGTFATSAAADMAEFTVTTNNLTGYSVTLLGSDASGQLVNSDTGDTLDSIAANTTETDFRTGAASTYSNKWGYRLNINNTTTTDFFSAPTSTTAAKTIYTTTSPNTTGTSDSFTLGLGARVDYTKPVGTYTNTFILTAVANSISYQINYLDTDGTTTLLPSDAESNITASSIELNTTTPTKSGYEFKGWCDGTLSSDGESCTGIPGTTYQPGDTYTFTNITSTGTNTANLLAMWKMDMLYIQEVTSDICTSTPITVYDKRDSQPYVIKRLDDSNCWMTTNLNLGGSDDFPLLTDLTSENTNLVDPVAKETFNGWKLDGIGTGAYTIPEYISVSGTDPTSKTPYGTLYNYCAASGGDSRACVSQMTSQIKPSYDICPAGWRLPIGGSSGEFQGLYNQTSYNSNVKMRAPYASGGAAFTLAGYFSNTRIINTGTTGYFWSSTRRNDTAVYRLGLNSTTSVAPAADSTRNFGASIRCVLQPTMQNFTTQEAESMATGESRTLVDSRDGKSYTVAKLADGQIWMTSNLNLAGGTTLNASDSDVPTDNYFTLPASSPSGFSSDSVAYVYNTGNETASQADCTSTQACNSYYSWLAATAGGKDASGTAVTGDGADAAYSICPKGWRLPKSGNNSDTSATSTTGYKKGDFYKLATAYGANLESSRSQNSAVFYNNAGPGTLPNFLLAGYYYSSTFSRGGTYGYYWSSSSYSSTSAYYLVFYSSYVNSANGYSRRNGFSVRCVFAGA